MKVKALWYGGSSYASPSEPEDVETFDSIADAHYALGSRESGGDSHYPCVEASTMRLYHADYTDEEVAWGAAHPFRELSFGPRGGIVACPC